MNDNSMFNRLVSILILCCTLLNSIDVYSKENETVKCNIDSACIYK